VNKQTEKMKIKLRVTKGEDRELFLQADNMNELVDKIVEWQLWENQALDFYKAKGGDRLQKEKESGWYFFKNQK